MDWTPEANAGDPPKNMVLIRSRLLSAVKELRDRMLHFSAKWASELLVAVDDQYPNFDWKEHVQAPAEGIQSNGREKDLILMAQTYFDLKDFHRVVHFLEECESDLAFFLRYYAKYLLGEKQKEEEQLETKCVIKKSQVVNNYLGEIVDAMKARRVKGTLDAFGYYLYGLVLRARGEQDEAKEMTLTSVRKYPYNWSAWRALTQTVASRDDYEETYKQVSRPKEGESSVLKDHWTTQFWRADCLIEIQEVLTHDCLIGAQQVLKDLQRDFRESRWILSKMAICKYTNHEFDQAERRFQDLVALDPHRLEDMDIYSNILYVREDQSRLSFLAHKAVQIDKYRPETCCIVGNYYSLRGFHRKALTYFHRALQICPSYLAAWTLIGHEHVEMRNTSNAIHAYRKAVDSNPRDYRAWYGLGQANEILEMYTFALYYFRKAVALRPYDSRMWCAMGSCLEHLKRPAAAIRCYEMGDSRGDADGIALIRLCALYSNLNDEEKARECYEKYVKRFNVLRTANPGNKEAFSENNQIAHIWLGLYFNRKGNAKMALKYLRPVAQKGFGQRQKEAKKSIEDILLRQSASFSRV